MSDNENRWANSNVSKEKQEEIDNLMENLNEEKAKYRMNQIFLNMTQKAACPDYGIDEPLAMKVKDIIIRGELMDMLRENQDTASKSGITLPNLDTFNSLTLTDEERDQVKKAVEEYLKDKSEELLQELNEVADLNCHSFEELVDTIQFTAEDEEAEIVEWQGKVTEQQRKHTSALTSLGEQLEALVTKHLEALEAVEKTAVNVEVQREMLELRSRILTAKQYTKILNEDPKMSDAYKMAVQFMRAKQEDYTKELEALRTDKAKFDALKEDREFQDIVRDYKKEMGELELDTDLLDKIMAQIKL